MLSSLQMLDLEFERDAFVELGFSLTCLKKVRTLAIHLYSGEQSRLVLKFPWQELPSLQLVDLYALETQFGSDILNLTQLPFLRSLLLNHCGFVDTETSKYFGVLMYHMALEALHVDCRLGLSTMSEHMVSFKRKSLKE